VILRRFFSVVQLHSCKRLIRVKSTPAVPGLSGFLDGDPENQLAEMTQKDRNLRGNFYHDGWAPLMACSESIRVPISSDEDGVS
jgi:hypothetical protein